MLKKSPVNQLKDHEILYQLLVKEHGYYRTILEITQLENEKLQTQQNLEEMRPLLNKKKMLLKSIQEIEATMRPLKKIWFSQVDPNIPVTSQIENEFNALNKLLKEILQLDLINQKILGNYILYLKDQIDENPLTYCQYG